MTSLPALDVTATLVLYRATFAFLKSSQLNFACSSFKLQCDLLVVSMVVLGNFLSSCRAETPAFTFLTAKLQQL